MSLCGPVVASGSTARPPGQKKSAPSTMESPLEEEWVNSSCHKEFIPIAGLSLVNDDKGIGNNEEALVSMLIGSIETRCTRGRKAQSTQYGLERIKKRQIPEADCS